MAWLPNGDLLITEREGGLRVVRRGRLHPQPLRGVPPSYQNTLNGLNEIVLDPEFKFNRTLYLALSEGEYDKHHTAVFRARYDGGDGLTEVERIFRIKDEYRGIGNGVARMIVMADGALLLAVPENNYYKDRAQKLGSHIGKILRIHRDGTVPQDNPFVDTVGALPEIWTYGHRVPTGLYQDPQSGLVWEVEPGPTGGDELNLLKPGGNYG